MARQGSYRRPDGRWQVRETFPNGERRSFYGKTEREAIEKKNRALEEYRAGLSRSGANLTVNAFVQQWLDDLATDEGVRPSTLRAYSSHFRVHIKPAMKGIRLRDFEPSDVNKMLRKVVSSGASPTTANRVRATLRVALSYAVRQRWISFNAAALSDARKEQPKQVKPPTVEQAQALIKHVETDRMGPLIITAIYTGLREGELLGLTRSDVDIEEETVAVNHTLNWIRNPHGDNPKWIPVLAEPKTEASRRKNHLPKPALKALIRQGEIVNEMEAAATVTGWRPEPGMDLVFPSTVGRPQNASNVIHRFKELAEGAGLPDLRFHDLRHLCASLLLAEGMDIFAVKEYLGHSQISQTANTYGHLMKKLSKTAAARLSVALSEEQGSVSAPILTPDRIEPDNTIEKREGE